MQTFFYNLTRIKCFFVFLVFQIVIFLPMVIFWAFWSRGPLFTYTVLAMTSSMVAGVLTLVAVYCYFKSTEKERLSYVLPLSFAVFPPCLTLMVGITSAIRPWELLPYEWGKFPRVVSEVYSIPFAVLTAVLISSVKLVNFFKNRRATRTIRRDKQ